MGRRIYVLICLFLMISLTEVKAETTSDLYNVYGVEDTTVYTQKEEELADMQAKYNEASDSYNYAVEYNNMIDDLNIEELNQKKLDKHKEMLKQREEIRTEGISMPYTELQYKYSTYKQTVLEYNELRDRLNKYGDRTKVPVPKYDFESMLKELTQKKEEFEETKKASDLGDISTATNFLQTTYYVKKEFDGTKTVLRAPQDTGVTCPFNGYVKYSDKHPQWGESIIVECSDGIELTFYGIRARYVQEGDVVKQYQKIATTNDGLSISISINGEYYDINKLYEGRD